MKKEFTTWDIINSLGLKRGRLREWIERGFVKPSIKLADGVGTKNLFSRTDVFSICLFDLLLKYGFPRGNAAKIIKLFSEKFQERVKKTTGRDIERDAENLIITRRKNKKTGKEDYVATIHLAGEDLKNSIAYIQDYEQINIINLDIIKRRIEIL